MSIVQSSFKGSSSYLPLSLLCISRVPYHCPEQKSLKEFLEALKSSKSKLVVEEKVEMKTHKFKLMKDVPKVAVPEEVATDASPVQIENKEAFEGAEAEQVDNVAAASEGQSTESVDSTIKGLKLGGGGERCE